MRRILRFDTMRRLRRAYGSLADRPGGNQRRRMVLAAWLYPAAIALAGAVGFAATFYF